MKKYFSELCSILLSDSQPGEIFLANLESESTFFCRLNNLKIRQIGEIDQNVLHLRLVFNNRQIEQNLTLCGEISIDQKLITSTMAVMRKQIHFLPVDPYILYETSVKSSSRIVANSLPDSQTIVNTLRSEAAGTDLVGIVASGKVRRGFGNSFGQENWFEAAFQNINCSIFGVDDRAVKIEYSGFEFDPMVLTAKIKNARQQLSVLNKPVAKVDKGKYRVFLTPAAVGSIIELLNWDGLSRDALETKSSPFIELASGESQLSPLVSIAENTKLGVAPNFDSNGFTKPDLVTLIEGGRYKTSLTSSRSAKRYGVTCLGSNSSERGESLDMSRGDLLPNQVLTSLQDGIYVGNLWYLNYSDRNSCRMTGMTRFGTFFVSGGEIVAPIDVMRFDESIYQIFGDKLLQLTKDREFFISDDTYGKRSTDSLRLPGALIEDFTFTL